MFTLKSRQKFNAKTQRRKESRIGQEEQDKQDYEIPLSIQSLSLRLCAFALNFGEAFALSIGRFALKFSPKFNAKTQRCKESRIAQEDQGKQDYEIPRFIQSLSLRLCAFALNFGEAFALSIGRFALKFSPKFNAKTQRRKESRIAQEEQDKQDRKGQDKQDYEIPLSTQLLSLRLCVFALNFGEAFALSIVRFTLKFSQKFNTKAQRRKGAKRLELPKRNRINRIARGRISRITRFLCLSRLSLYVFALNFETVQWRYDASF